MNFRHYAGLSLLLFVLLIVCIPLIWGIHETEPIFKSVFGNVEWAMGNFLVAFFDALIACLIIGILGGLTYVLLRAKSAYGWHAIKPNRHGNYAQMFDGKSGRLVAVAPGNHAKLPETFTYHHAPRITSVKEETLPELPLLAETLHEQPTLETVIEELRPNSLEFVFGMDSLSGQLVKTTLPKAVHIQLVGASGQGKSRQAMSILTQLCVTNDPAHLQLALIDHEGETSSPFWNLPHVTYMADEPKEAARIFRFLVKELDRRDITRLASPVLLIFCEEFLNLRRTMPTEYRAQALEDYTSLTLRGRKRGMFVFSIGQTSYTEKTIRDAQAQFLSSMAFAVKPTAARAVGFTNNDLLKQLYSEKKPGQFLLERPAGDALLMAPYVEPDAISSLLSSSLLPPFSPLSSGPIEEVSNMVESGQQGGSNESRKESEDAQEANVEQVRALLAQGTIEKAKIIQAVWNAKPGSSEKYRNAEQEYRMIMIQIAQTGR